MSPSSPPSAAASPPAYAQDRRAKKERARASLAFDAGWNPFLEPGPGPFFSPKGMTPRPGVVAMFEDPAGWAAWVYERQGALRALPKEMEISLPHYYAYASGRDTLNLMDALLGCGLDPNRLWRDELALANASEPMARVLLSRGADPGLCSNSGGVWGCWALRAVCKTIPEASLDWIQEQGAQPSFAGKNAAQLPLLALLKPPSEAFFERVKALAGPDRLPLFQLDTPERIAETLCLIFLREADAGQGRSARSAALSRAALDRVAGLTGWPALISAMSAKSRRGTPDQVIFICGDTQTARYLMERGWSRSPASLLAQMTEPAFLSWFTQKGYQSTLAKSLGWLARRVAPSDKAAALAAWRNSAPLLANAEPLARALLSRGWLPASGSDSLPAVFPNGWPAAAPAFGALLAAAEAKLIKPKAGPALSSRAPAKARL